MQSRWYLPPGRTLADTKIAERAHSLHINKTEWGKITKHLDRKKLIQETLDKEKEYRIRLKEGSENMTKNWEDSIDNLRHRKEESRKNKFASVVSDLSKNYLEVQKGQEAERAKYVEKVRKSMYMKKPYSKSLNSALLESEVDYERKKQVELNEVIKEQAKQEAAKWAKIVKDQAAEEVREQEHRRVELKKKQLADRELFLGQFLEKERQEKEIKDARTKREKQDAENMATEMKALEAFMIQQKKEMIELTKQKLQKFREIQEEEQRQADIEDQEIEEIINIQSEAKRRIDCMIKNKNAEIRRAEIEKRENLADFILEEKKKREEEEERVLQNAIAEKTKRDEEKDREKKEYEEKMQKELKDDRDEYRRKHEEEKYAEKEFKKWEMLNRLKQSEIMEKYNEEHRIRNEEQVAQYKAELDAEIKRKQEINDQRELRKETFLQKMKDANAEEDANFFEYAKEVLELAKSKGRSTYPIERVIRKYKKEHLLSLEDGRTCGNLIIESQRTPEKLAKDVPGKKAHYPQTDPTYSRCRCYKNRLYK